VLSACMRRVIDARKSHDAIDLLCVALLVIQAYVIISPLL